MYFANPWGLAALASLPLIAFIHLYQRRFPPLEIAGLFLWLNDERVKAAGQRIDRLPVTATLLLELLAATVLSLLLAQPRWHDAQTVKHLVIVLDNSASMLALDSKQKSTRDKVVAEIEQRVRDAGRSARVTLIATGRRPVMLAGPATTWTDAAAALANWRPQDSRHDFHPAWDMALQLADSGQLVFFTDTLPDAQLIPDKFEVLSFGEPAANLAFEAARWTLEPETLSGNLYLRVRNFSSASVSSTLSGRAAGREIIRETLELKPSETVPLSFAVPGGTKRLTLTLESSGDALATDSQVTLIEPQVRTVRVSNELPESFPGRAAIERAVGSVPGVEWSSSESAHLRIGTTGLAPQDSSDDRWRLILGPLEPSNGTAAAPARTAGPYLLDRRHEILEGVSIEGVVWGGVQSTEGIPLTPLISVASQVLLGQTTKSTAPGFVLNVDLTKSNLADSPAWPILINNLVESCRDNIPGLRQWNYRVDEGVTFRLPANRQSEPSAPLVLKSEKRDRKIARGATIEIPPLLELGVFEVRDEDQIVGTFATNFFDPDESDLRELGGGESLAQDDRAASGFSLNETPPWVWIALAGIVLLAMVGDWAVLRRDARREVV